MGDLLRGGSPTLKIQKQNQSKKQMLVAENPGSKTWPQSEPFAVEYLSARQQKHLERRLVRELDADALHQLLKS
jgi:hypothetical protein